MLFLSSVNPDDIESAPNDATEEWNTEPNAEYRAEDAISPFEAWYSLSP